MNVDYSNNAQQRTPCVLVLDASGSMGSRGNNGKTRIDLLNEGVKQLELALKSDEAAVSRVQIAIVIVGGPTNDAELLMDWTDANYFQAFPLSSGGVTPLGKGIRLGLEAIENGKSELRQQGISYTRPWLMIISDGEPTDPPSEWQMTVTQARQAEQQKKAEVFCIGVEGANLSRLGEVSSKPPLELDGLKFSELFIWLSSSLSAASRSRPGDTVQLPSTDPWRNVGI